MRKPEVGDLVIYKKCSRMRYYSAVTEIESISCVLATDIVKTLYGNR